MASLDDILTAAKNLVQAVSNAASTYQNVNGSKSLAKINATTLVSSKPGRVVNISLTTAGSTAGTIYDANAATDTSRPIYSIPTTPGLQVVNLPVSYGIVITPGTSQVITVSYS